MSNIQTSPPCITDYHEYLRSLRQICMYLILQTTVSPGHASLIPQKVRTVLPISHMVDALTPLYHAADMHYGRQRLRLWRSERRSGNSVDEQTSPSNNQALSSNPTPTSPPRNRPQLSGMVAASTRPFCRCNKIGELSFCQRRH